MTQNLEQRVAALEAQTGQQGGQGGQAGQGGDAGGQEAMVQAFLHGALAAYAASQQQPAQGLQAQGGGGAAQGLFGWIPTRYDTKFWCRSRIMCNPNSISCLC
jgi:hypothetical protein